MRCKAYRPPQQMVPFKYWNRYYSLNSLLKNVKWAKQWLLSIYFLWLCQMLHQFFAIRQSWSIITTLAIKWIYCMGKKTPPYTTNNNNHQRNYFLTSRNWMRLFWNIIELTKFVCNSLYWGTTFIIHNGMNSTIEISFHSLQWGSKVTGTDVDFYTEDFYAASS